MKHLTDKKHLLTKYCEGQLNDHEWQILERWMALSDDNRSEAQQMLKLYRHNKAAEAYDSISHEEAFRNVLGRVQKSKRRKRFNQIANIAATIVITLGIGSLLFWLSYDKSAEQPRIAEQTTITPGSTKATLILGNGEQLILDNYEDSIITSMAGTQIQISDELLSYQQSQPQKNEINVIRTPRGGEYNLLLADGTKVWLNAQSELKYPVAFTGNKREITLSGEAYMEVAHNQNKPFIVHTSKGAIEVLGTSFNIKDYKDEKVMATTLVEGKVRLSDKKGQTAILKPSMQGVVSANNKIELKEVDVNLYTSWKDGLFAFRNQTLGQMMQDMSRWYDFKYWFDNKHLKNIRFTGEIERYENPEALLKVLEKTHEVTFEYKEGILLIK